MNFKQLCVYAVGVFTLLGVSISAQAQLSPASDATVSTRRLSSLLHAVLDVLETRAPLPDPRIASMRRMLPQLFIQFCEGPLRDQTQQDVRALNFPSGQAVPSRACTTPLALEGAGSWTRRSPVLRLDSGCFHEDFFSNPLEEQDFHLLVHEMLWLIGIDDSQYRESRPILQGLISIPASASQTSGVPFAFVNGTRPIQCPMEMPSCDFRFELPWTEHFSTAISVSRNQSLLVEVEGNVRVTTTPGMVISVPIRGMSDDSSSSISPLEARTYVLTPSRGLGREIPFVTLNPYVGRVILAVVDSGADLRSRSIQWESLDDAGRVMFTECDPRQGSMIVFKTLTSVGAQVSGNYRVHVTVLNARESAGHPSE